MVKTQTFNFEEQYFWPTLFMNREQRTKIQEQIYLGIVKNSWKIWLKIKGKVHYFARRGSFQPPHVRNRVNTFYNESIFISYKKSQHWICNAAKLVITITIPNLLEKNLNLKLRDLESPRCFVVAESSPSVKQVAFIKSFRSDTKKTKLK